MTEIIQGAEPLGPRVVGVNPQPDHQLIVSFNNGEQRHFDARPLLDMKVFAPLKNEAFFNLVRVSFGTIAWPNDIDYCPDTLYDESRPIH